MSAILTVGDTVLWRGSWGSNAPRQAVVTGIEHTEYPHDKYGEDVNSLPWTVVRGGFAIVSLENGHWAYGDQLEPLRCAVCGDAIEEDGAQHCLDCAAALYPERSYL